MLHTFPANTVRQHCTPTLNSNISRPYIRSSFHLNNRVFRAKILLLQHIKMSTASVPTTPTTNLPVSVVEHMEPTNGLPPPYEASQTSDDEGSEDDFHTPQTVIHINASTSIRGHNNTVVLPGLDQSHLAAHISHALRQHNYQLGTDAGPLTIRIDRSVHVTGDRNAVGDRLAAVERALLADTSTAATAKITPQQLQLLLRRAQERQARGGASAVRGVKRKADGNCEEGQVARKTALGRAESCPPS